MRNWHLLSAPSCYIFGQSSTAKATFQVEYDPQPVRRTACHADAPRSVYEMPTAAAPENAMAKRSRPNRVSGGLASVYTLKINDPRQWHGGYIQFRSRLSDPQSSMTKEKMTKTGIDSRLL